MKTALILFAIALTIRLAAILFWRFDGLYGQDPYAYHQQAVAIMQNLPQGRPPPTGFFWPNGYPLLVALLMAILGPTALAGQLVALICGALLAPLTYGLSRDLLTRETPTVDEENNTLTIRSHQAGLLSSLIVAVAGQPILSSVVVMADMPALFWATLSVWGVVRAVGEPALLSRRRQAGWFLAAGVALAFAIVTRWLYALVVLALGLYAIFKIDRHKQPWWLPLPAIAGGPIILCPQLWLTLNKPDGLSHYFLLGWRPINFFLRSFETPEGQALYRLPTALFYAQPAGHPAYIFPLLGLAALWAIWQLWRSKQWDVLLLLLGWAGPVYLFLAGIPSQNFRFGLTLYLPFVILTGYGLSDLWARFEESSRKPKPSSLPKVLVKLRSPVTLNIAIALSIAGMLAWAYPMLDRFLTVQNESKAIARQIEQRLPAEATLLTFGLTLTLQHYAQLNTLEIFYFDEPALATLIETQQPVYLLLDLNNIERQWQGHAPQINYQWLREHTTLSEIGHFGPYSLFKVEAPNRMSAKAEAERSFRPYDWIRRARCFSQLPVMGQT